MLGENCHLIEQAIQSGNLCWEADRNLSGRNHLGFDTACSRTESITCRRMKRRIHQLLYGVSHVLGGKGCAVGERNSAAQAERDLPPIFRDLPRERQLRLEFLG